MPSAVRLADGAFDFSYGVDSSRVTTVQSQATPQGLPRNALAWMNNATVRGGGITQRTGFLQLLVINAAGLFQGEYLYQPAFANPYKIMQVGGRIYKVLVEAPFTVTDLSAQFGLTNPPDVPQVFMEQAEQFLVIQAGDIFTNPTPTLPLFWDGTTLRRSIGLGSAPVPAGTYVLTPAVGWVVPPVGGSVVVTLNSAYPGALGDVLNWPGIGVFTVTGISGNTVTLVTVSSPITGFTVVPANYTVAVTQGPAPANYTVTTTNSVTPGPIFNTVDAILTAPYPGQAGDTINWIGIGTFLVLGLSNANQTVSLQTQANLIFPGAAAPGSYSWIASPPATPSGNVTTPVTTTGSNDPGFIGNTFNATLAAPYVGTVGDTLYWIGVGTFKILGFSVGNTVVSLQTQQNLIFPAAAPAGNYTWVEVPQTAVVPVSPPTPEIPAAGPMVYYQDRLWYANGRTYTAGDIVGGPSGTLAYDFTDSVLKVTENPLAIGGDGFKVPIQAGNITAMAYTVNLNTALGEGPLYVFTRKRIYKLDVPITRSDWIAASGSNLPLQTLAQIKYGTPGDRGVPHVNGDLFYPTVEPAIRSLFVSQRYFSQWSNVPISNNENRVLGFSDRALLATTPGIEFSNRLLMGVLPRQTSRGVAFDGLVPLDFDLISTLQEKRPPAWEGMLEGMATLQLTEGDFGGRQRAFATVVTDEGGLEVWEITDFSKTDNVDSRVQWQFETPAWTFEKEFEQKQLDGMELWVDRISGTVKMQFEYRPDADACWHPWSNTEFCAANNSCEDVDNPICYPIQPYCEGNKFPITLPTPPVQQGCQQLSRRPINRGYQFQVRVTIKGFCRVRGLLVFALPVDRKPFEGTNCEVGLG